MDLPLPPNVAARDTSVFPIRHQEIPNSSKPLPLPGQAVGAQKSQRNAEEPQHDLRFWAIIGTMWAVQLLAALEHTVITTSLPHISQSLHVGDEYVWIINIFFLTSAAVQPLFGQVADIFGRRWLAIFIVAIFTLGSGICGGANGVTMLLTGRAIQGIGSGGVNMIVNVIISDLVSLRQRGNFIAMSLATYGVGSAMGPFMGGAIIQKTTWRWVFYLNLPVGGVALALLYAFLRVKREKGISFLQKIKRVDIIGNTLLMASTGAILLSLAYGGTRHPWSSWRIITPLVGGLCGFPLFMWYENFCPEPVTPPRLLQNRTSASTFALAFLNSAILYWVIFFLPIYFQAVLGSSPARSGLQLLPIVLISLPVAAISALVLTRFGRYKPLHMVGFAITTLGLGLFAVLGRQSSTAAWVTYQLIAGSGYGLVVNTILPAFQAGLAESDQAAATASYAFISSFGGIWGFAIPAAIFNNRFEILSGNISDPAIRNTLSKGQAFQYATISFIKPLPELIRQEVINTYSQALKFTWQMSVILSGVAFLLVFCEKEISLRRELETKYGLKEKESSEVKL